MHNVCSKPQRVVKRYKSVRQPGCTVIGRLMTSVGAGVVLVMMVVAISLNSAVSKHCSLSSNRGRVSEWR